MTKLIWVGSAAVSVAMLASPAMAINDPIPGVDIIVKKNPGGIALVEDVTDMRGGFTVRLKAAGRYTLSTACPAGMLPCPPRRLSVFLPDGGPASGARLIAAADGSYDVIVAKGGTALRGVVCTTAGSAGLKSVTTAEGNMQPDLPGAAINTSRSNIKRPSVAMAAPDVAAEPPGSIINTSRSNIKHPSVAMAAADLARGCALPATQDVSTAR